MMICRKKAIQRLIERLLGRSGGGTPRTLPDLAQRAIQRLPATHQQAAQRMGADPAIKSNDYLNKVVKTSSDRAHPEIVEFYRHFNAALKARGMPFYAFEFFRSPERQKTLKAQGVSKAGPWQSPHNFGCAVDVVHATRFWDLTTTEWSVIGAIGKEVARKRKIDVEWGGDWKFYDPAHWELKKWRRIRWALFEMENNGEEVPEEETPRFAALEAYAKKHGSPSF